VSDSLSLRQFCRVYWEAVPDDTTLIRWAQLIGPATLQAVNDRVVALARPLKVTRGRKLRVDSTVGETHIHHPTDSGLLGDGVRVVSRLLRRAKGVVSHAATLGTAVFRTRTRSAPGGPTAPPVGPAQRSRGRGASAARLPETPHDRAQEPAPSTTSGYRFADPGRRAGAGAGTALRTRPAAGRTGGQPNHPAGAAGRAGARYRETRESL